MSERAVRWSLALIVGGYLILGLAYSLVNPVFESPDEALNYENIRFFIKERSLPVLEPDEVSKAHHPPLYYVLGALVSFWVPNENLDAIVARENPFWAYRLEPGVDNKSLYLHDPDLEDFRDVALGVLLVRWLSLLMGAGTILCVYGTARELFPRRLPLAVGSAALVAFNPMVLFISASVHDDPLANLVATAVLCVTARLLVRGATARRAAVLGLLIGMAILTKLTCLLVVPTVGLALFYRLWIDRGGWRQSLKVGAIVAFVALLVGGWWLVRNQILYGDPTSMGRQMEAWEDERPGGPDIIAAVRELGFLHDSAWGAFGYGQIPMPAWTYGLTRLLGLVVFGGLVLFSIHRQSGRVPWEQPPLVLLIVSSGPLVVFLAVFIRMISIDTANFGRYLFVSLAFLAPLYALGVGEWLRPCACQWLPVGLAVATLTLALFALVGVLRPAYASPAMLSVQKIQSRTQPADLRFGDSIRLIGYDTDHDRVLPGGEVTVTLCWEALAPMEENYVYFVHILGPEESKVGARDTHPGLGRYPTRRWSPGEAFCDAVRVAVGEDAPAPAVYDVAVGWYLYEDAQVKEHLPAYDASGAPLDLVTLGKIKVKPEAYPAVEVPNRLDADLDGQVTLLGYDIDRRAVTPGGEVNVTLYWAAQAPVPADYTIFLHLAAPDGPPYAQADGQPQHGAYPTSFWDVGEIVVDSRTIVIPAGLPPGEYPLVTGMYLLETGERLPWLALDGSSLGDAVPLLILAVGADAP
ncbi:MAG: glycosyltransferase family 39 protein [Anaerolineae bacterium]|nr:glycosyltransferase family 39 protein [Anaerolineae bacterium]